MLTLKESINSENRKILLELKSSLEAENSKAIEKLKTQLFIDKEEIIQKMRMINPELLRLLRKTMVISEEIMKNIDHDLIIKYNEFTRELDRYIEFVDKNYYQFLKDSIFESLHTYESRLVTFRSLLEAISVYLNDNEEEKVKEKKKEINGLFNKIIEEHGKITDLVIEKSSIRI